MRFRGFGGICTGLLVVFSATANPVIVLNRPAVAGAWSVDRESLWTVTMAILGDVDEFTLVDRAAFHERLTELAMSEMDLTRSDGAVRLGRLLGAEMFVNARCARMSEGVLVTVQAVNVATGRTYSGYRMVDSDDLVVVAREIAALTGETLRKIPRDTDADDAGGRAAPELPADAARPRVAVHIEEDHVAQRSPAAAVVIIDPAAETEMVKRLIDAAFPVIDLVFRAARERETGDAMSTAAALAREREIDYLIYGEAISELGDSVGAFRGARARVEIKTIDVATGRIVFSDSAYGSATDLAEAIAGKAALQAAANRLADRLLPRLLELHAETR